VDNVGRCRVWILHASRAHAIRPKCRAYISLHSPDRSCCLRAEMVKVSARFPTTVCCMQHACCGHRMFDPGGRRRLQQSARALVAQSAKERGDGKVHASQRQPAACKPPRVRSLAIALFAVTGPSLAQTMTCEVSGSYRRCFDHRGYLSTEERSGDYTHGWDSTGHAWTTWEHDGRAYTWPTR